MASLFLQPYCLELLDTVLATTDACALPQHLWSRWVEHQSTEVLLVEVSQLNQKFTLHVASHHDQNRDGIFLPPRVLAALDASEYVEVNVLQEMPPLATKIVLQPLDEDVAECVDVSHVVSEYLSKWHTLKQGTILSIECEEVGGLMLDIIVKEVEPAEIVLLRGEVPLEIDTGRPPTPVPAPIPVLSPAPVTNVKEEEDFSVALPQPVANGFAPFSGKGYRLGGP